MTADGPQFLRTETLSVSIARPPGDVFAFLSDPANLPRWAFFRSATETDDGWVVETGGGVAGLRIEGSDAFGVVDHFVRPPSRPEIHIPLRVVPNGAGSEVLFTLFQIPVISDAAFAEERKVVRRDLARLKQALEGGDPAA